MRRLLALAQSHPRFETVNRGSHSDSRILKNLQGEFLLFRLPTAGASVPRRTTVPNHCSTRGGCSLPNTK
ncbi:hypothetical protein RSAG8_09372, partial [Rhizoctonia solani AG-8 WAC10335]